MNRFAPSHEPAFMMQPPAALSQAAPPAAHGPLRRAQAALAALAGGPCGTETVSHLQAVGRVLAQQPDGVPLPAGTLLAPPHAALLASRRVPTVQVYAPARVGIACVAAGPQPCRTVEALLSGLVHRLGARALSTRCPATDPALLPRAVDMLLAGCDIVLLCGELDEPAWQRLLAGLGACGVEPAAPVPSQPAALAPLRIAQQAGKLVVQFGTADLGPTFASFVLLLSPMLRHLQGRSQALPPSLPLAHAAADDGCLSLPLAAGGAPEALLLSLAHATGLAWQAGGGEATCFPLDAWLS